MNVTSIAGTGSNTGCITVPYTSPFQHIPYGNQTYTGVLNVQPQYSYAYQIRIAANGFVCVKSGSEYVFETMDSLCAFLKEQTK